MSDKTKGAQMLLTFILMSLSSNAGLGRVPISVANCGVVYTDRLDRNVASLPADKCLNDSGNEVAANLEINRHTGLGGHETTYIWTPESGEE